MFNKLSNTKGLFKSLLIPDTSPIIMVVGGSNEDGLLNDVEIISETNSETCSESVTPMMGLFIIRLFLKLRWCYEFLTNKFFPKLIK